MMSEGSACLAPLPALWSFVVTQGAVPSACFLPSECTQLLRSGKEEKLEFESLYYNLDVNRELAGLRRVESCQRPV